MGKAAAQNAALYCSALPMPPRLHNVIRPRLLPRSCCDQGPTHESGGRPRSGTEPTTATTQRTRRWWLAGSRIRDPESSQPLGDTDQGPMSRAASGDQGPPQATTHQPTTHHTLSGTGYSGPPAGSGTTAGRAQSRKSQRIFYRQQFTHFLRLKQESVKSAAAAGSDTVPQRHILHKDTPVPIVL